MNSNFTLTAVLFSLTLALKAQPVTKAATDAFLIARMAEKFHVEPRPVNKELSAAWFDQLIEQLDEEKLFFTQEDIRVLQSYRQQLDDQLLSRGTIFLKLLIPVYMQCLKISDSLIDDICRQPFRFTSNEKFTLAEIKNFPPNAIAQRTKWYKMLKAEVLEQLIDPDDDNGLTQKLTDSGEASARKRVNSQYKRLIKKITGGPGGVEQEVCTAYCEALALCFDPHSTFLPATEKENFESHLGSAPMQFGLQLNENKNGEIVIDNLKPGSPAFKSGQLNTGDIIQSVKWEGKESIDLTGAGPSEIADILNASNHDKLEFTVKKADGAKVQVGLTKEKSDQAEDDIKIKSSFINTGKKIGYISLPAFYTDWETSGMGMNGCSDDIAKELIRMKKEGIQGLILDLRYNGGGSMTEAVDLAGIFIDAGPVAQIKSRDQKVFTEKDINRGSIYDGPLLVLVNGYSASASEVLAGTLQDYNRALIVGSPTYGKATAQVILPLDTTIDLSQGMPDKQIESYLKLTVSKLYRINGTSAQATGVQPDIELPDLLQADPHREIDAPFAFGASKVEANKYYKPATPLPVAALQAYAKSVIDTTTYFQTVNKYIAAYKQYQAKDVSLTWTEAVAERKNSVLPGLIEIINQRTLKDPYIQAAAEILSFSLNK